MRGQLRQENMATTRKRPPGAPRRNRGSAAFAPRFEHYLRAWREAAGLDIVEMEDATGRSNSQLGRIERGEEQYIQQVVEGYAIRLGCSPADLLASPPSQDFQSILELYSAIEDKAEFREILELLARRRYRRSEGEC